MSTGCWARHPRAAAAAAAAAAYRIAPPRQRLTARPAAAQQQHPSSALVPPLDAASPEAGDALLAAACGPMRRARAGTVPGGHRGLLASHALAPGDEIISLPLHSALCVPEHPPDCPAARAAAAAALGAWQGAHGLALPGPLAAFLLDGGAEWEARLAAWLLWLVQRRRRRRRRDAVTAPCFQDASAGASQNGSTGGSSSSSSASDAGDAEGCPPDLWDLYVDSLPAPHEMSTFYDFTEDEAETWLALSSWRDRAADYRKEALSLHERYFAAPSNTRSSGGTGESSSSGGGGGGGGGAAALAAVGLSDSPAATAWAVGLVRSRTFGRSLGGPLDDYYSSSSSSSSSGSGTEAQAAGQQEEEERVSLLMVPGADLVNHSFNENAAFQIAFPGPAGGHPGAQASPGVTRGGGGGGTLRLVIRALRAIAAGEEVTISYGADKRNATLLANYGFILPGNPNDRIALPPGTAPPPGAPRRPALSPSAGCPSASGGTTSSSGGSGGTSGERQMPPVSPSDLDASFANVAASNPQLQRAAGWWRRRGALLSLGVEPCPQQPSASKQQASDAQQQTTYSQTRSKQQQQQQQEEEANEGLDELRVALSVCRQLESHLTSFLRRHSQDGPTQQTGAGAAGGSPRPARLSAAMAAAEEHSLLVRECAAVCEAELAAAGVAVA